MRLPPPRVAPLASKLDGGATIGGAAVSRAPEADRGEDRRHAALRVRLRARGVPHHYVPGGHRGQEHVAGMYDQGKGWWIPWFI